MSRFVFAFAVGLLLLAGLGRAEASVVITVNKSTQRLSVVVNGTERHRMAGLDRALGLQHAERHLPARAAWRANGTRASTTGRRCRIRSSSTAVTRFTAATRSRHLGRPASHGCIRLQPKNAAVLFSIVQANRGATRIVVTGDRPSGSRRGAADPA